MVDFSPIIDKYGLPLYKGDAGDAPANLGRICLYYWLINEKGLAISMFYAGMTSIINCGWQRHPVQYKDDPRFKLSSDQMELLELFSNISFVYKKEIASKIGFFFPNKDIRRLHQFESGKWAAYLFNKYLELHLKLRPNDTSDSVNFWFLCRVRLWPYGNTAALLRYFGDNDELCRLMRMAIWEIEAL